MNLSPQVVWRWTELVHDCSVRSKVWELVNVRIHCCSGPVVCYGSIVWERRPYAGLFDLEPLFGVFLVVFQC